MVRFLIDNEIDVQARFIERNRNQPQKAIFPFDQSKMRKSFVRQRYSDQYSYRLYVKGAPEMLIPLCDRTLNQQNEEIGGFADMHSFMLNSIVAGEMARNGFKTLSYAYKDITE